MVYGIRPDSAFFRAGLRNGDIVKDIDGTTILSVEDASRLFSEMDDADMFRLNLIRRGEIKELVYQAVEPDADAGPIPEDDDADVGPLPAPDDKEKGEE
jgi:general secretion pathway protein C